MKKFLLLATLFSLGNCSLAYAGSADETTTLTTPIVQTKTAAAYAPYQYDQVIGVGGPLVVVAKACVPATCALAQPTFIDGTETVLQVGLPTVAFGANKTTVSGFAVEVGLRSAECNRTKAQVNSAMITQAQAGKANALIIALKGLVDACLGGT